MFEGKDVREPQKSTLKQENGAVRRWGKGPSAPEVDRFLQGPNGAASNCFARFGSSWN